MPELEDGCVKPGRGPLGPAAQSTEASSGEETAKEVSKMSARVGKEAPDFEANAFVPGVGFKPVKLSGYKGRWIVLCFYPAAFTFV